MVNWINTISREHVLLGVEGGFTQANHGRLTGVRQLSRGDWIVFYSPRNSYPKGAPVQAFTALGQVVDDEPYQVEATADFHPYRRLVEFVDCVEAPIRPLIDGLDFIEDKTHWGYRFRFGLFSISDHDFALIRSAMTARD